MNRPDYAAQLRDEGAPRHVVAAVEETLRRLSAGLTPLVEHGYVVREYLARRQRQDRYGK